MNINWRGLKDKIRNTVLFEQASARIKNNKISHSQYGEDLHIQGYYDRLAHDRGILVGPSLFVDIGAFRPIVQSNSYFFYKRGWKCINVDATPGTKILFDRVRPKDTNLEVAIAPSDGAGTFYLFGIPSVWNTLDRETSIYFAKTTGITPQEVAMPLKRLDTLLREHAAGYSLEILSIDAEGYDLEILKSNDFSKYRPRVILIETHDVEGSTIPNHEGVRFLRENGYTLHSWINPNLMFIRNDSLLKHDAPDAN